MRYLRCLWIGVVWVTVFVPWCSAAQTPAASGEVQTGRLVVTGEHVTRLVLRRPGGARVEIHNPAGGVDLAVGTYDVYEIELEGGLFSRPLLDTSPDPVTIAAGEQTTLNVGAPLRQVIVVEQDGRVLYLEYFVLDALRNRYQPRFVGSEPQFDVFRGDKKIGGGMFQHSVNGRFTYLWRIPLRGVGALRIVPSWEALGELTSEQGQPTLLTFRWYNLALGLLVWLTLIPAVLFSKSNYTPRAMVILAAPVLTVVVWWAVRWLLPFDAGAEQAIGIMVYSLTLGTAVLWLAGEELARCGGLLRGVAAAAVMLMVGLVAVIGAGTGLTGYTVQLMLVVLILTAIAVSGYVTAWWRCRADYSLGRFVLWLAAGMVGGGLVLSLLYMPVALISGNGWKMVAVLPAGAMIFALIVLLVNLPFMAVAAFSPLYRRRLDGCLGIQWRQQ